MARTLVTGASGFIAQQLILDLLEQGHSVRGTVRSAAKGDALKAALGAHSDRASEIEIALADLESDHGWADAVAGIDVVHHLASPFPMAVPRDPDELIRPARDGALRVLRAAARAGVGRVVLTSSGAAVAYGVEGPMPERFTEADWTDPAHTADCRPYVASKTVAERAAWDYVAGEGRGVALTTIQPVAVLGPIRSAQVKTSVDLVARMLDGRLPLLPNAGIQVVDVRDVAAAHIAAMNDPAAIGERYIVADAFRTMKEMAAVLREAYPGNRKIPSRAMPDLLVKALALVNAEVKTIASELHKRRILSSEKVRKLLGRDLIGVDDAIRASAETLVRYGAV
ncbi:MAG: NAD-dependent epimerase/dehydratase family protein [Myxococcota bacterium]